jgi:hypothetical protein
MPGPAGESAAMAGATVRGGTIIPDVTTIKQAIRQIQAAARKDPALRAALQRDPRAFLADRGFPGDVQRELLIESGKAALAKKKPCVRTCLCSVCCYTKCKVTIFVP